MAGVVTWDLDALLKMRVWAFLLSRCDMFALALQSRLKIKLSHFHRCQQPLVRGVVGLARASLNTSANQAIISNVLVGGSGALERVRAIWCLPPN